MLLISSISLGTDDYGVSLGEVNVYAEEVFDGDGNLLGLKLTVKAEGLQEGYNLDLNGVFLDYDKETGNNKLSVDGEKANSLTGTSDEDGKILWDVAESLGSTVGGSDGITTNLEGTAFFAGLSLADIDGHAIGIRATSTGFDSEGSLKLVGEVVVPPDGEPPCDGDSFPIWPQDISHIVLYFDTTKGDTNGDGYYTVKIEDWPEDDYNNLNDLIDDIVAWLVVNDDNIDENTVLLGVHIKGGTEETTYYDIDCDPTDVDDLPGNLTELVQDTNIDKEYDYNTDMFV
jgi:hypothetical protein